MPEVDLNQKVWGVKLKTHFMIFPVLLVFASFPCLLAVFDYMSIPSDAPEEAGGYLFLYFLPVFCLTFQACVGTALLFCCTNRFFYRLAVIVLVIMALMTLITSLLSFFTDTRSTLFVLKQEKLEKKYYKFGKVGMIMSSFTVPFAYFYLAAVLNNIGNPPLPRRHSRHSVYSTSHRREEEDYEDSDREEEPRSRKPRTPEKSGRSEIFGQQDKTGRSGKS